MFSVFILLLKVLFSSNTSSTKSLRSFCFFLFSYSIVYRIKCLFEIKELIVLFLCFCFCCFSILNLCFNVGMFNFFMFEKLKWVLYQFFLKLIRLLEKVTFFLNLKVTFIIFFFFFFFFYSIELNVLSEDLLLKSDQKQLENRGL